MSLSNVPKIKYLENEIIEEFAITRVHDVSAKFGHRYPFDVEGFLWKEYGYKLIPSSDLERGCEVDTALICCKKIIRIDEKIYNNQYLRARFSMAHELAHLVLHEEYIEFVVSKLNQASKTDEYKAIIQSLSENESKRAEFQAHYLGGAILAPKDVLDKKIRELIKNGSWGENEYLDEAQRDAIYKQLGEFFEMTKSAIVKRLVKSQLDYIFDLPLK